MMIVPLLIGSLVATAAPATVRVASCVIVTGLALPLLTAWWVGRVLQPAVSRTAGAP